MRTPWANDIWASRSSAAMPILPDPSGVAGVSVSAATAFTGAAERRRNRSATEQDATVHNIKCGKLSVQVLADGADPRVAEHRRHTHTVSPLADTRGFERCETSSISLWGTPRRRENGVGSPVDVDRFLGV